MLTQEGMLVQKGILFQEACWSNKARCSSSRTALQADLDASSLAGSETAARKPDTSPLHWLREDCLHCVRLTHICGAQLSGRVPRKVVKEAMQVLVRNDLVPIHSHVHYVLLEAKAWWTPRRQQKQEAKPRKYLCDSTMMLVLGNSWTAGVRSNACKKV
eukprot:1136787-Pelagomonas_calceolata.AAC.9